MKNILVTGGGGFVGSALVKRLLAQGCRVRIAARNRYPAIEGLGAEGMVGDLGDHEFVTRCCQGIDTIFHTAAKAGVWGPWAAYRRSNIEATAHLLRACRDQGVQRLVYTSTPSVVFDRADIHGGNEQLPYPRRFLCHYARSKAIAEQHVLTGTGSDLRTCAIRPHLIVGPGDPHLLPRLIERGRRGQLRIVGNGDNLVDISYIDNVVEAHLLVANQLEADDKCAGKAYFIGQERPVNLWSWINELFMALDIPPVRRRVPRIIAFGVGALMEAVYTALAIRTEPKMTRFVAEQLARSHYFSHAKAEHDFGYRPVVTLNEAQQRLLQWIRTSL